MGNLLARILLDVLGELGNCKSEPRRFENLRASGGLRPEPEARGLDCIEHRVRRWRVCGRHDGGPALKRVLDDIKYGKIETVIVYKVDRLTRSLNDFSKIIEVFDSHSVSLVSVTQ